MNDKIAYIYCRINQEDYDSLQAQDEACRAWIEANGFHCDGLFYDETGAMSEHKPCFEAALILIADNAEVGPALVVTSVDRLSRNMKQFVEMRDAVEDAGGTLVVADLTGSNAPEGSLIQNLIASKRQLEADTSA